MFVLQLSNFNLFFSLEEQIKSYMFQMSQKAPFPLQPCAGKNEKCQFLPPESKPLAGRQPFQRTAHFVTAAAKQGKLCANKTKHQNLYLYRFMLVMLLRTVCTTFSLQGNVSFPLTAENNTKNEAAIPECKQKHPAKHGEVADGNVQKCPRTLSAQKYWAWWHVKELKRWSLSSVLSLGTWGEQTPLERAEIF